MTAVAAKANESIAQWFDAGYALGLFRHFQQSLGAAESA